MMNGTNRVDIKSGLRVLIVLKKDQRSGKLTEGIVKDILTKSPTHPHGSKVRLEGGEIGRVKKIEEHVPFRRERNQGLPYCLSSGVGSRKAIDVMSQA